MKQIVIIGASGHGKVVADIALKVGYTDIVFLDDNDSITECAGFPVVGNVAKAKSIINKDMFVAIGDSKTRERIQNELEKRGTRIVSLVHPNAVVSRRVKIGSGSVIMAGTVVNSDTEIGRGVIVNTCASVDHDCVVESYSHISVGAHLSGTCFVGENTWVGTGAVVSNNCNICGDCTIGAGAVVVKDIEVPGVYIGVPAKIVRKK